MNWRRSELVRDIRREGYEVVVSGGGHLKVKRDGVTLATIPASPGDGVRGEKNSRAMLRRLGILPRRKEEGA